MLLHRLERAAIVVPSPRDPPWLPQTLGAGSVVGVVEDAEGDGLDDRSPVTGQRDEILVAWADLLGRVTPGFLSRTAMLTPLKRQGPRTAVLAKDELKRVSPGTSAELSALDVVRSYAGHVFAHQASKKKAPYLLRWLSTRGRKHTALLQQVVRELGGLTSKRDDPDTVVRQAAHRILKREVTMRELRNAAELDEKGPTSKSVKRKLARARRAAAEEKEMSKGTRAKKKGRRVSRKTEDDDDDGDDGDDAGGLLTKSTPKRARKRAAKRSEGDEGGGRRSSLVTAGTTLVPLLKGHRDILALAKRLANDEALPKKQLLTLRDGVKEAAADAREADDGSLASKLSAANRLVRRLVRSA